MVGRILKTNSVYSLCLVCIFGSYLCAIVMDYHRDMNIDFLMLCPCTTVLEYYRDMNFGSLFIFCGFVSLDHCFGLI